MFSHFIFSSEDRSGELDDPETSRHPRRRGTRIEHEDSEVGELTSSAEADIHHLLRMISRDLRGANALARACLAGLATISAETRGAIETVLALEEPGAGHDPATGWGAEGVIALARRHLNHRAPAHDRLCDELERALVNKAALIEGEDAEIRRRA
jgi:hypothetical protein